MEVVTRFVMQQGAFVATNCFPFGLPNSNIKCARRESWICRFTSAICASPIMVTRLALYCVCDHEHFMSFDIAKFFQDILDGLSNLLVLLGVVLWE